MNDPVRILVGDCRTSLRELATESVQCVWTSPPYWGKRSYLPPSHPLKSLEIGCERRWQDYVTTLVDVFREIRRVLRSDGVALLNLGDTYATDAGHTRLAGGRHFGKQNELVETGAIPPTTPNRLKQDVVKAKDLCMLPHRVAIALQEDGWYVRAEIVWNKPDAQPESVRDRATRSHEFIFHLTRSEQYVWNEDEFREPHVDPRHGRAEGTNAMRGQESLRPRGRRPRGEPRPRGNLHAPGREYNPLGRNRRCVWTCATASHHGVHTAVAPAEIIRPFILAGSQPGDIVLDPFGGTGMTASVAITHGRRAVLCELNPVSVDEACERLGLFAPRRIAGAAE